MTLLLILLLGASHGVQPDHPLAVSALAARLGVPAWVAALRLALGHSFALLMLALALELVPGLGSSEINHVAAVVGATTMIVIGCALLARVWRNQQEHVSSGARPVPLLVGWLLGLAGTRAIAVLPLMARPHGAPLGVLTYSLGIAAGITLTSAGVDSLRHLTRGWLSRRAVDGTLAVGAMANGCWLLLAAR